MRLIARYAKDCIDHYELITLFDKDEQKEIISKDKLVAKSIAKNYPSAIWFERKIRDDFGIEFEDSFDKRELIHHEYFPKNIHPMLKDFDKFTNIEFDKFKPYDYELLKGDGIFAVSVGPVHAGIIEPGHFHFSQAGEMMFHLEVRHFYKYRAIEKMVEGLTLNEAKPIIERISGNESVAYQIALQKINFLSNGIEIPKSLYKEWLLFLEIERVIHHLTDIGFIPNDAGFASALSFASKLAEDARRVFKYITNSRFGFGAIKLHTTSFDKSIVEKWLKNLKEEINFFIEWIDDIPSIWDRLDTTGKLKKQKAKLYGTVGVMARASGLALDVRADDAIYQENGYKIQLQESGDVAARFKLRLDEIKNSIEIMQNLLNYKEVEKIELNNPTDGEYRAFVESSIGELFMQIDIKNGVIDRFFARDASFVNWQVMHTMMEGNIIADFPLINKSCDLSYAGSDL